MVMDLDSAGELTIATSALRDAAFEPEVGREERLKTVGRVAASSEATLGAVLDAWARIADEASLDRRATIHGAAWLAQAHEEATKGRVNDSLRATENSLAWRQAELSALHRVNAAANSSLDEKEILSTVVQVVAEVMEAPVCSIYLLEPPATLVLSATKGLRKDAVGEARMGVGTGITGWAAKERRTLAVADLWHDPRSNYLPETAEESFHSIMSVPIVNRSFDRLIGVLNVQTEEAREFGEDEIGFVEMISSELALAVENARSYALTDRQLQRKVEELTMLRRVIAMVVSSLEVQRVLDSIAEGAFALAEADASAIVVVGEGDATRVAAGHGLADGNGECGRVGDGPVGRALATGQPVAVPDIASRRLGPGGDDVALQSGFRSMFLVPFQGRHSTRGALCLYSQAYRNWTREEVDLVVAFADEAAVAIENAALYEEAQRGLATKSVLLSELHHRVKNNLQTVASLLSLGLRHATVPEARHVLEESRTRVQSIAAVHDLLSQGDVGLTTVAGVARKVAEIAELQGATTDRRIGIEIEGERVPLGTQQATTLAIVLNELLTNTLRHGFKERSLGRVRIGYALRDRFIELSVSDDGAGLPEGFDPEIHKGLGLSIVDSLTRQDLHGELTLRRRDPHGTVVEVRFPANPTGAAGA